MLSLVAGLREFFREPVTLDKANEEIKRALETREQRFLDLVRTQVYDREAVLISNCSEWRAAIFPNFNPTCAGTG
jgi:hypothetical protein